MEKMIKETLEKQLQLLSKRSENTKSVDELCKLSDLMLKLSQTIHSLEKYAAL